MRGHVYKRGTTWTAVYDEGHDEHGRRRQRSKGGFATRRDAQKFLTDVLARLGDGSYAAPSKATLGDFLTGEWLPAVEGTVRPLTYTQHVSTVRARLGDDPNTVLATYAHLLPQSDEQAAEKVAALIGL